MTIELRIPLLSQLSLQMPLACDLSLDSPQGTWESALTPLLPKDHVETCHWPLTQTVLCSLSLVRDSYQQHCLGHNLVSSLLKQQFSICRVHSKTLKMFKTLIVQTQFICCASLYIYDKL